MATICRDELAQPPGTQPLTEESENAAKKASKNALHHHTYCQPCEPRRRNFQVRAAHTRTVVNASAEHTSPFCVRMETEHLRIRVHFAEESVRNSSKNAKHCSRTCIHCDYGSRLSPVPCPDTFRRTTTGSLLHSLAPCVSAEMSWTPTMNKLLGTILYSKKLLELELHDPKDAHNHHGQPRHHRSRGAAIRGLPRYHHDPR